VQIVECRLHGSRKEAGPNLCSWKKQKPVETKEKLATVPRGDSTWASLGQQLGLKSQLLAAMQL
jgi:hypothetical protein